MTRAALAQVQQAAPVAASKADQSVRGRAARDTAFESGPAMPRFSASLAALPAAPRVQRTCAACEAEEETVRPRRRPAKTCCDTEHTAGRTPVQPSLEVGPAQDGFEREADSIAVQALAAPAPEAAGRPDSVGVRRKRAACAADEKEVRARPAESGGETRLAASPAQLSSGGRPLPESTRAFFEERMGRDLSHVRVHDGAESQRLNRSVTARAFTYGGHVWLGHGERPDTSFTMAHELGHVLQQTQPAVRRRGAGARASAARPAVRRKDLRAFWLPDVTGSALALHSVIHNKAVDALGSHNGSLIQEAPIPNATRFGFTLTSQGWADLFKAKTTIGLQQTCTTPPPGGTCLDNFTPSTSKKGYRGSKKAGGDFKHDKNRQPQIDSSGNITGLPDDVPKTIQIGDMKPGHNTGETAKGVKQINHYVDAIKGLVKAVNDHQTAKQANTFWSVTTKSWSLDNADIPPGWDATQDKTKGLVDIKLRYQGKDYRPVIGGLTNKPSKQRIPLKGRWVLAKHPDPTHAGVWVYFMRPDSASLKTAFGRKVETKEIKTIGKKLQQDVLDPLTSPPKKAPKKPTKRSLAARTPIRATAITVRVQRAPKKKPFVSFEQWEEDRVGKPGAPGNSLKGLFEQHFPATEQEAVIFKGGAAESVDALQEQYGNLNLTKPPLAGDMIAHAKDIRKFQFWVSPVASFFGRLRGIFGGLFAKVLETAEKLKKKIGEKLDGFSFRGSSSGIKGVARKVGGAIVKFVGTIVARRTMDALRSCLVTGVERKMNQLIGGEIEQVEERVEQIKVFVEKTKDELISDAELFAKSLMVGVRKKFDEFSDDLQTIVQIVGGIKTALNLLRLGGCVAGGLETLGIACIVALLDFGLSFVGLSPTEFLAGKIMKSCKAKKAVYETVIGVGFIRDLPKTLAREIVTALKKVLPKWAEDLLCNPEKDFEHAKVTMSDFNCDLVDKEPPIPPEEGGDTLTPPQETRKEGEKKGEGSPTAPGDTPKAPQGSGPPLPGKQPLPGPKPEAGKVPAKPELGDKPPSEGGKPSGKVPPAESKKPAPPPPTPGKGEPLPQPQPGQGAGSGQGKAPEPGGTGQGKTPQQGGASPGQGKQGKTPGPREAPAPGKAPQPAEGKTQGQGTTPQQQGKKPAEQTTPSPGKKPAEDETRTKGRKQGEEEKPKPGETPEPGRAPGPSGTPKEGKPPAGAGAPAPGKAPPIETEGGKAPAEPKPGEGGETPAKPKAGEGGEAPAEGKPPEKTPDELKEEEELRQALEIWKRNQAKRSKGAKGKGKVPPEQQEREEGEGEAPEGKTPESKAPEGEAPERKAPEGEAPEGKPAEERETKKGRKPGTGRPSERDRAPPPERKEGEKPVTPEESEKPKQGETPEQGGKPEQGEKPEDAGNEAYTSKEDPTGEGRPAPKPGETEEVKRENTPEGFKAKRTLFWQIVIEEGLPSAAEVQEIDPRECLWKEVVARFILDDPNTSKRPDFEFRIHLEVNFCSAEGPGKDGKHKYFYYFPYDIFIEQHQLLILSQPGDRSSRYVLRAVDPGPPPSSEDVP